MIIKRLFNVFIVTLTTSTIQHVTIVTLPDSSMMNTDNIHSCLGPLPWSVIINRIA